MPRPRPPRRLKAAILPAWNAAIHRGRRLGEYLDAARRLRFERCPCCGRFAAMLLRPRVIPDRLAELWGLSPTLRAALVRKESLDCSSCGAKLRARRIAATILDVFPATPPARSVADWATTPDARQLRVAELNRIDGLHDALTGLTKLSFSDFRDGVRPGIYVDDVRNEDLTALTYADGSFDLVLTSETLEHVPDLAAALGEIRRVLAPGGGTSSRSRSCRRSPGRSRGRPSTLMGRSATSSRRSRIRGGTSATRSSPSSGPTSPRSSAPRASRSPSGSARRPSTTSPRCTSAGSRRSLVPLPVDLDDGQGLGLQGVELPGLEVGRPGPVDGRLLDRQATTLDLEEGAGGQEG